ncbi:MAG TPA: hypothetical protein VF809_02850 [Candidatus Saccharimonadales bacterium]
MIEDCRGYDDRPELSADEADTYLEEQRAICDFLVSNSITDSSRLGLVPYEDAVLHISTCKVQHNPITLGE